MRRLAIVDTGRRSQWMTYQDRIDAARLVFIDETWTGRAADQGQSAPWPLEDDDLSGRAAL